MSSSPSVGRVFLGIATMLAIVVGFLGRFWAALFGGPWWQAFCSPFYCFYWLVGAKWPFESSIDHHLDGQGLDALGTLLAGLVGFFACVACWLFIGLLVAMLFCWTFNVGPKPE